MNTGVISPTSLGASGGGTSQAVDGWTSSELVKVFGDRVFSIAKLITQNDDDTEDILIETFLEACSNLDESREAEELWVWLLTIAVKEAFSKRRKSVGGFSLDQGADSRDDLVVRDFSVWADDYQQRCFRGQTTRILEDGLQSLDPMARTIFVLRDIERISVEHIASIVNRPVAKVKVCLLRARLQLRELLAPQMRHNPSTRRMVPDGRLGGTHPRNFLSSGRPGIEPALMTDPAQKEVL